FPKGTLPGAKGIFTEPAKPFASREWIKCAVSPILPFGPKGSWDENIRERMWVIFEDGKFHAWYCGWKGKYDKTREKLPKLGYATSDDGVRWKKYEKNPIFTDRWVEDICVLKYGDTYYMYCEDESNDLTTIHLLTSKDKLNWTEHGDVLTKGSEDWERGWVGTPLVWIEGKRWYMLYEGGPPGDLGLAFSNDGKKWKRCDDDKNPVITHEKEGKGKEPFVAPSSILKQGDTYTLIMHPPTIATSKDLINWKRLTSFKPNPDSFWFSAVLVDAG
ncbi:unnamed protein product, partial [marine sediment metagenome]